MNKKIEKFIFHNDGLNSIYFKNKSGVNFSALNVLPSEITWQIPEIISKPLGFLHIPISNMVGPSLQTNPVITQINRASFPLWTAVSGLVVVKIEHFVDLPVQIVGDRHAALSAPVEKRYSTNSTHPTTGAVISQGSF